MKTSFFSRSGLKAFFFKCFPSIISCSFFIIVFCYLVVFHGLSSAPWHGNPLGPCSTCGKSQSFKAIQKYSQKILSVLALLGFNEAQIAEESACSLWRVLGILESLLSRIPGKVCEPSHWWREEKSFYLQYASHLSTQQVVLEVLHCACLAASNSTEKTLGTNLI